MSESELPTNVAVTVFEDEDRSLVYFDSEMGFIGSMCVVHVSLEIRIKSDAFRGYREFQYDYLFSCANASVDLED